MGLNRKKVVGLVVAAVGLSASAMNNARVPVLQMRLRANHTESEEQWARTFFSICKNLGCCDEVWFSTGTGAPSLDWHRARAKIIARGFGDLRGVGIAPALQFQATLGHGDALAAPEMFAAKTWTGWTGSQGLEDQFCNCPRQPEFLVYVREVSRIYAALEPTGLWIDDDLRYNNHRPATDGSRLGCWCATCVAEFNAETGGHWTRETLDRAMADDAMLEARWRTFSIKSLCGVARVIGEEFCRISPRTMLALQQGGWPDAADSVREVLKTLNEVSGRPVGYRPGGGAYYDIDPYDQMSKSFGTARFRRLVGDPAIVSVWTPELESCPRAYGSRTAQSAIIEGFASLMYGMNAVSYFLMDPRFERDSLYSEKLLAPLASAASVLRGYAEDCRDTDPVGFMSDDLPLGELCRYARVAIPVLPGVGRRIGDLTARDLKVNPSLIGSAAVQDFRDELDARAGGVPAKICSPFTGFILPRVTRNGMLKNVALINTTIDGQGPVRLFLRGLPNGMDHVVWRELRREPVGLEIVYEGREAVVTIPRIDAWNGGYLELRTRKNGDSKVGGD